MTRSAHLHPADVRGALRLAADATGAVTDIVEAMHGAAVPLPPPLSIASSGISGLAYAGVRHTSRWIGMGIDLALAPVTPLLGEWSSTPQRDALVSVLSGVVGDHLADTANPLAVRMELRRRGRALTVARRRLATDLPRTSPRIAVFVHGLCGTDGQWKGAGFDYGLALERDFGFTPVYLRYNSGLHVSTNGRLLARLLDDIVREWPAGVDEVLLVGHSMGGLVLRSAVHYASRAGSRWPASVRRMVFLGTPHHGAPLERGGAWFEEVLGSLPFAGPLARLGRLRSAGITDLRHGSLLDEDWHGEDRFARGKDSRRPVPLPPAVECIAVAATTGAERGDVRDQLLGDGLVPVASALGHHRDPARELGFDPSRTLVVHRTHHMGLLGHPGVHEHVAGFLERP